MEPATTFERGTQAGGTGDRYARITVLLATVLLIVAIGQRFRITSVRLGLLVTVFLLLCLPHAEPLHAVAHAVRLRTLCK